MTVQKDFGSAGAWLCWALAVGRSLTGDEVNSMEASEETIVFQFGMKRARYPGGEENWMEPDRYHVLVLIK
jgi:hypothetical protein